MSYTEKLRELRTAKGRLHRAQQDIERLERELFPAESQRPATARQLELLTFLWEAYERRDPMPTLREIGHKMDISSTNGVQEHLRALERKGFVRLSTAKARSMKLTEKAIDYMTNGQNGGDK